MNILSLIECKLNSIADAYKDIQFGQFVYWKKSITIDITDYIKLTDSSQNYITTLLDDPIIYAYNSLKESLDKDLFIFANINIIIEKLFPNNTDISDRVSKASKQLRETIYKLNHPNSIATLYDKGKLDRYIITQLELDKLSEIHPSLLCCNAGYFAPDGKYYFIEMNTRIQVEHPVTEMVTGVDLVREQIRIAAHLKLNYKQSDIELKGHALECRINAENPQEGFRPSPGIVSSLHIPGGFGVRIDTTLYQGYQVSSHYDSMIAKVIVHGRNRIEAIRKMRRVLSELVIDGIDTNQELQYLILHESDYVKGNFDTSFIEKHLDELVNER